MHWEVRVADKTLDTYVSPAMHKRLLSIVVLYILVVSPLIGCSQGQSTPSLTVFSTSGGNVSVMKADAAGWVAAEVGMSLEPGDIINCGDESGAEITFVDGSTIELQAGTEIEVALLAVTDAGCATIRLRQTIGTIIFRVIKMIDPGCLYEVETPAAMVVVRGSAVQVYVIEDGTTWACNLEGDIWAFAQGVEVQVPEGRCCVIRPGQAPNLICDLTISSTTGGSVTNPREGTFPYDAYDEGTVVELAAQPEEGYRFVNWTGDVSTIADVNSASTNITMNDNYSVRADFETISGQYALTISGEYCATVLEPGEGTFIYDAGTVVQLSAGFLDNSVCRDHCVEQQGCIFYWSGDVDTIEDVSSPCTTITMNGNYSITAVYWLGGA